MQLCNSMEETFKKDIRSIKEEELKDFLELQGEPSFRAKQILDWVWRKSIASFDEMSNVGLSLRESLNDSFTLQKVKEDIRQESADGTMKYRIELHDGLKIEAVMIPVMEENRFTACVSSQVGCSLSCTFCATGKMNRMRNLTPWEIYEQVRLLNDDCLKAHDRRLSNIVYMGMGEPLLNYGPVLESINRITSPEGLGFSPRRITLSTAGIAKQIKKLADDNPRVNLALSLHAADDAKRSQIMPINEHNNLQVLIEAIRYFYRKSGNKISFEYIAFQGFNDSIRDAENLVRLCSHFPVLVNVIEYNPVEGVVLKKSDADSIDKFAMHLRSHGIMVTVRKSRGKDIDAACGQLANQES